jgi:PhnB protein
MIGFETDIVVSDANAAYETYQRVFGAETIVRTKFAKGLNEIVCNIAGSRLRICDENHDVGMFAHKDNQFPTFWLNLLVENINDIFDKGTIEHFATILPVTTVPARRMKHSIQSDPWGIVWMLHQTEDGAWT